MKIKKYLINKTLSKKLKSFSATLLGATQDNKNKSI